MTVCVPGVVGVKRTHSQKGKMWNALSSRISSCGLYPTPASSQGGVFPISMPVLSISVCEGIQVGVYPLHTRRTFPVFLVISRLCAPDLVLSFSQVSAVKGYSSLSSLSSFSFPTLFSRPSHLACCCPSPPSLRRLDFMCHPVNL